MTALHTAVQALMYEVDPTYQPDGRLAVDANADEACDIPDGPRPCGGWRNPAGTLSPLQGKASGMKM